MMTFTELAAVPSDPPAPFTDQLRPAVAAYLARFKGSSREHTESDLRCYLAWCAERGLDPLAARRPHLELYIRWMQQIRRFKPSTVSRGSPSRPGPAGPASRTASWSITRRARPPPHGPPESPTLGFTHLQSGALLTAARQSPDPCDFALVAMLGLLGLRIFEATSVGIAGPGEEHGHRVLLVCGKGAKVGLEILCAHKMIRANRVCYGAPVRFRTRPQLPVGRSCRWRSPLPLGGLAGCINRLVLLPVERPGISPGGGSAPRAGRRGRGCRRRSRRPGAGTRRG